MPLTTSFRFVHEPLQGDDDALPMLGNASLVEGLRSRIIHSHGGAFLITGFRGVGKTTLVLRALSELSQGDEDDLVVPVVLSVARSTDIDRLLFAVTRRVFESLHDRGLLSRLPADVQQSLLVAYMRTSLAFKQTRSEATERGINVEASNGRIVKVPLPKVVASAKRTRSLATEAQFLAYSETDVEHDIIRIVSLLHRSGSVTVPSPRWRGWLRPWSKPTKARIRLVVVLDEADKLTSADAGLEVIEKILGGVKNVLTMPGVHFLVVAGPDLHDHAIRDAARGNSIYESVFGWRLYVPCSWSAVDRLLDVVRADTTEYPAELKQFRDYLQFKARGIPRRLLQEFNGFVSWAESGPTLHVQEHDAKRVQFYANLEVLLSEHLEQEQQRRDQLFSADIDEDRRKLSAYYVVDWVLRSEGEPFSSKDLVPEGEPRHFDPALGISEPGVARLLEHLQRHQIIEYVRRPNATATIIGDANDAIFKLSSEIRRALFGFAAANEAERAALQISALADGGTSTGAGRAALPPVRVLANRYELREAIGRGGMGTVYRGFDRQLQRVIAVKTLGYFDRDDPGALVRFRREADIAAQLRHPQIVRTYDAIDIDEGGVAIIMELMLGSDLASVVAESGALPPDEVVQIGRRLAGALSYLNEKRIARIDLKPSNIVMEPRRGPVIVDFGIARQEGRGNITAAGQIVGTPMYMAPETIAGGTSDHRSDIYSLGLVLYFCAAGKVPWESASVALLLSKRLQEDIDTSTLPVSAHLRDVIATATSREPDDRFQNAAELDAALAATSEST
ncbi:protein kinase [Micromonospora sp. NPDC005413]|uniref:protein kinase domain-containing protein n=1 Tax=Micromonospora sp. NPDC005413 TaxID=3154563 RepID=UPI0033AAFAAA